LASMQRKEKSQWIKPVLVGAGLILVFASLLESTFFLNTWTGFAAFGVDTVTYYGFNVYSDAVAGDNLLVMHYGALAIIVASMFLPSMFGLMKRSIKQLPRALTS
jgi:hypothetical protein